MFDPVWFGNSIIPRWEALVLLAAVIVVPLALALTARWLYSFWRQS